MAESMTSDFLSVTSCTRIIGMGIAMECMYLRKYTSRYVWMTLSHSIVAPRYPWGVKNKSLMRSVPDPSLPLVKGLAPRLPSFARVRSFPILYLHAGNIEKLNYMGTRLFVLE